MIDWAPLLAVDTERFGIIVRGLAVVGSGVLGGFGIGLLLQGAAKLMTGQKVPRMPLQLVRVLGAVTTGWAAFLLLSGSGGSGFGGRVSPFGAGATAAPALVSLFAVTAPVSPSVICAIASPTAACTMQPLRLAACSRISIGCGITPRACIIPARASRCTACRWCRRARRCG